MLNSTQAATLANMQEVVSVFRSRSSRSQTTRSWDFLDLTLDNSEVTPLQLRYGEDIIVGVLDTGVWPESESFQEDPSMCPIPSTWKGECVEGERFEPAMACNKKLIGARYYLKGFEQEYGPLNTTENFEYRSPRDFVGHGTHTASTAVGAIVEDTSFFDLGKGTARGGAPRARLAVYKVCWNIEYSGRCSEADIMAAFDDALHDGVHIISASFGPIPPLAPLFKDTSSIGSFHAMQQGVTVVFSAGNYDESPEPSLVGNVEPWSICVAASSVDRTFPTNIIIGDNNIYMGESLITIQIKAKLVDASTYFYNGICEVDYIKTTKSGAGRIVLCFSTIGPKLSMEAARAVKAVNATGLIFVEPMSRQLPDVSVVPTVLVNLEQGTKIKNYLAESPRLPKVQIEPSKTVIGKAPAPTIAYFSSRGPSSITPDILKPDISAPGVNILAAWPPVTPPSLSSGDLRSVSWNFQSGTSMACPHVAGVAALIKSAHPNWSPAAIRSALMTTAYTLDTTLDSIVAGGSVKVADPFDMGAGHMDPLKALDPGLIYDIKPTDYFIFLCNMGFTQEQINKIIDLPSPETSCKHLATKTNAIRNYPTITVSNLKSTVTIKRTARNVGRNKNVIYFVSIFEPCGVEVVIWPKILIFSWFKQESSYYVTLKAKKESQGRYDFGEIIWSDGFHYVRSPLAVCVNTSGSAFDGSNYYSY